MRISPFIARVRAIVESVPQSCNPMLAHPRKLVCLSFRAVDLPLQSTLETAATLYRKDAQRFQLLLKSPAFPHRLTSEIALPERDNDGLLWLELSPRRVVMTVQGRGKLGYRHVWENGAYGTSRYWLQEETLDRNGTLLLKNFTRRLHLSGESLPDRLHLEYELYANQLQLGQYILSLEIQH